VPGQAPDDLAAIGLLLTEPPPAPEVIEAARLRLAQLTSGRAPAPLPARPVRPLRGSSWSRRGPRWLAPAAAAAAVVVVIAASLLIARTVGDRSGGTAATGPEAIAKVPPFFVMIGYDQPAPAPAIVSASATGAVLGSVPVPRPAHVFSMAAAAGNGREFVLAASRGQVVNKPVSEAPTRLYRLLLSKSGHPGRLTPLPIGIQTREITGLALSRDGRELAVSLFPPGDQHTGAVIKIYSLATGAERDWVWPGRGWIGITAPGFVNEFAARSLSWTADGSRLLFQVNNFRSRSAQIRLLDTTGPGGNLRTSSQPVPIAPSEMGAPGGTPPFRILGPLLVTGDGTRVVGVTTRTLPRPDPQHPAPMLEGTITEFSVRTGKPVRVADRQKFVYDTDLGIFWVNRDGTAMIAYRPAAKVAPGLDGTVGVLTPRGFTPFPAAVLHFFTLHQPDW
jgi:hypothetical protein